MFNALQTEAIDSYTSQVKLVEHRLRASREAHGRKRMEHILSAGKYDTSKNEGVRITKVADEDLPEYAK
jgi:hypothetical protein